jgi:hypothetical protein
MRSTACGGERSQAWDKGAGFSRPVRTPAGSREDKNVDPRTTLPI